MARVSLICVLNARMSSSVGKPWRSSSTERVHACALRAPPAVRPALLPAPPQVLPARPSETHAASATGSVSVSANVPKIALRPFLGPPRAARQRHRHLRRRDGVGLLPELTTNQPR
jgi:hypothetical protein